MSNVSNLDIAGMADRVVLYAKELLASQSASQSEFIVHDRTRCLAYLNKIEAYKAAIMSPENPLDLPKTHASGYPFADFPAEDAVDAVENPSVKDVVRRLKALWIEVTQSQSADQASGMMSHDGIRFDAIVESTRGIVAFAGSSTPDLPETADNDSP